MKSFILALSLTLATSSAFAQYFRVNAQVTVNSNRITAVVSNTFYEPVECTAITFGRLNNGQVVQSRVRDIVPMNQYRQAYLYSNIPGLYFTQGWAEAQCRFLSY